MTVSMVTHLSPTSYHDSLRADVRAGLTATPKTLPPKYFYDERGSELFDEITRLEEYYPTRTERSILLDRAAAIVAASGADTLVELGSGTSEKTRILLDAFAGAGVLRTFVPFDVDSTVLHAASTAIAGEYPGVDVCAVVGDFEHHLGAIPKTGRRMVAFLGSTIGNLPPDARAEFLAALRATLNPGDSFLLGTDLVKDADRLVWAYDDKDGVTAEFNRNVLAVINRELHADFDIEAFSHVALWNDSAEWIEMHLRSDGDQRVRIEDLDLTVDFADGELTRTEISAKFRKDTVAAELEAAGFRLAEWWTDPREDFALSLSVPA
ncbi:MAG: L-histidine N(alpha)-methyltransferase [Frankiaceae bacterium]|nr:L-histidine N(alpha)-methyltransferase [Frankiaceae bacterium]MBV9871524.1 L-histidine N(alpha)-methyltransferase [Frankiaceae bacterium]